MNCLQSICPRFRAQNARCRKKKKDLQRTINIIREANPVRISNYQEKVMRAGLRTSGNSRWETVTVAMGRMATKSLMRQS